MPAILNYRVEGEDSSLALALVHPLGSDLSFWDNFVRAIDGRFTTVAFDLRASGRSFTPIEPPGLRDHAGDIEALRLHLGIAKFVPVGCAIGSMIAATYAAIWPTVTPAVVLSNPTPGSSEQARKMLTERAAITRRDGIKGLLPDAVERAFLNQPMDERYWAYYRRFETQDAHGYALSALGAANSDATEFLQAITCPTLLVAGRHDILLPIERARAVNALIPHAQFAISEDAAHFVPFQQSQSFAHCVVQFLSENNFGDARNALRV